MLLHSRDAASIAAGAWLGFYFFASDLSHCIPGGIVLSVLLLSLCTMESHSCYFQFSAVNRSLFLITGWPLFIAGQVLVQSYSAKWGVLLSVFYAMYYILSEPSWISLAASTLIVASYEVAQLIVLISADARSYAVYTLAFCSCVQVITEICVDRMKGSHKGILRYQLHQMVVSTVLLAPIFVVHEVRTLIGCTNKNEIY